MGKLIICTARRKYYVAAAALLSQNVQFFQNKG